MDASNNIECYEGDYWNLFWLALLGVAVYVIGIPLFVGVVLFRNRHSLTLPSTLAMFGFVYTRYGRVGKIGW